ncbi:MAG: DegV family protein [Bacilli bacterium]
MSKIHIVTDSTFDLTQEEIKANGIHVIPLSISIDGVSYLDGVDVTAETFIEKMNNAEELPKTSQPAVGDFIEKYDELTANGDVVLSIHLTSGMSGTYSSAASAGASCDGDVTVVDSMFISRAGGYQVLEACRLRDEGKSVAEIVEALKEIRENTRLYVIVDKLDNLVKGGRIGRGQAMIGSLLHIKPIANLADGVYTPLTKVRSHTQVAKFLVHELEQELTTKKLVKIDLREANSDKMKSSILEMLASKLDVSDVFIGMTTPVITTHTGEGAVALMYLLRDK